MSWQTDFPRLDARNHRVTSPATDAYNCVAWAAGDTEHWWQPGEFWPVADWPIDDYGLGALEQAFLHLGFVDCGMDAKLEPAVEKIAIYGDTSIYTHVARQLSTGKWTSKLGKDVDIEHEVPEDVAGGVYGGVYGEVAQIMKRPIER
jgi:hypothetical protein